MKKWQILIPSVMVASTPLVALTACNKNDIKFEVPSTISSSGNTATFELKWKPKHNLAFISGRSSFIWDGYETPASVAFEPLEDGIANVTITFDFILSQQLDKGILKFQYVDKTTKSGPKWKTIKSITITQ